MYTCASTVEVDCVASIIPAFARAGNGFTGDRTLGRLGSEVDTSAPASWFAKVHYLDDSLNLGALLQLSLVE